MSDNNVSAPVVAGLAVGILFVVLFASVFNSSEKNATTTTVTKNGIKISLNGLKSRYSASESLYFTVTAKGYGSICSPVIARIVDMDSQGGKEVFHFGKKGASPCSQLNHNINETWTLHDIMSDAYAPFLVHLLYGSGHYKLIVEYAGATLEEDFIQD